MTNVCCLIVHVFQHRLLVPRWTSSGLADSEHPKNPCKYQCYNTVDLQLVHINYLPHRNIWEERETNVIGCWGVNLGVYFISNHTETPQVCEKLPPLFQLCCKKNLKIPRINWYTLQVQLQGYLLDVYGLVHHKTYHEGKDNSSSQGKIIHPVRLIHCLKSCHFMFDWRGVRIKK